MEQIRQFTPEQEDKLTELRERTERERVTQKTTLRSQKESAKIQENYTIKVGSKVQVNKNSETVIGHVLEVKDNKFIVSTPHGIIKDVTRSEIKLRYEWDYTGVVIPEELKAFTTKHLVDYIQTFAHKYGYSYKKGPLDVFSELQIRAELSLRPNIKKPSKRLKRLINKTN